mgnify:CR=1 FL=1
MNSIIQSFRTCIKCGNRQQLHVHHCIHGTANRKLCDKDGLTVMLCAPCHATLHDKNNDRYREYLEDLAQRIWMKQ